MSLSTPRDAASPTPATTSSKPPLISELSIYSVVLGDQLMKPNYPSLHREDLLGGQKTIGVARLYVCPRCFKYTIEVVDHIAHWDYCKENLEIPGLMIYESADQSIYEFDGTNEWLFAQNLCLFAKLFIETKSVCYDVSTFLYYLLVKAGKHGPEIVGFFSKEKLSWDNNNLACIVVFPPWLKQGLGQVLMAASYALSQRDGRLGGPERRKSRFDNVASLKQLTTNSL
ncbi:hypothetical protein FH972_021134 [Carpinus fangiana]|uniref:MYST-type HAT domain-containing protein n=1 Tax=Carpinus fangiana TaxID=176857 RepID=A0A5N6KP10_9ROSI|nr:hypothetical protein FH972_021134 [Carpinus fangiana]